MEEDIADFMTAVITDDVTRSRRKMSEGKIGAATDYGVCERLFTFIDAKRHSQKLPPMIH